MTTFATSDAATRTARLTDDFLTCLNPVSPGAVDRLTTVPKVRAMYAAALEAIPDARFTPDWTVFDGTRAVLGGTVRGTHLGVFRGVPATGRVLAVLAVLMIEREGDAIADLLILPDSLAMAEQIGLLAPLGPKACAPFKNPTT